MRQRGWSSCALLAEDPESDRQGGLRNRPHQMRCLLAGEVTSFALQPGPVPSAILGDEIIQILDVEAGRSPDLDVGDPPFAQ